MEDEENIEEELLVVESELHEIQGIITIIIIHYTHSYLFSCNDFLVE
jgi:hypothetical protein